MSRKTAFRFALMFGGGAIAMIVALPILALVFALAAISFLLFALFEPYYDPLRKNVFPCLRYPSNFDNYNTPEFNKPDICVDLRPHTDCTNPLKQSFKAGQPYNLVFGITNDNDGSPLREAKLKVEFPGMGVIVNPGLGWGYDGDNKYIFKFGDEAITKGLALNAGQLQVTFPYSTTYSIATTIIGTKRPITHTFHMYVGSTENFIRSYAELTGIPFYRVKHPVEAVATANAAYTPFGRPNDPIIRPCHDAKEATE